MPAKRIQKGGTRGSVYRDIAHIRLADSASLLSAERFNGAIYLAGYAIECHLKFAYCKRKDLVYLPASLEIHGWDTLATEAGVKVEIDAQRRISALYSALAEQWGPALRYTTTKYTPSDATRLYKEMKELYQFLRELVP